MNNCYNRAREAYRNLTGSDAVMKISNAQLRLWLCSQASKQPIYGKEIDDIARNLENSILGDYQLKNKV